MHQRRRRHLPGTRAVAPRCGAWQVRDDGLEHRLAQLGEALDAVPASVVHDAHGAFASRARARNISQD
jgi:hypothetical protein